MDIYTAEQEIDVETHDLLGPRLTLEETQKLCQDHENWSRDGSLLRWAESTDGLTWKAEGSSSAYWITKWEI